MRHLRGAAVLAIAAAVGPALLLGCAAPSSRGGAQGAAEATRPRPLDVLLITIDTLRADAVGAYAAHGRAEPRRTAPSPATPWMDRLAATGVRFETAYAHNVVTLPAHASILSGLYPQAHGVRDNSGFRMPGDVATLATLLAAAGYRTGAFVSAFPLDSRFGLDRGFEVYEDSFVGVTSRPLFLEQERAGRETVELAREWLDQGDARPWLCWVHLYEPHFPYAGGGDVRRAYAADVTGADAALEPLLRPFLEGAGGDAPLIVLTSDHGEALGEHGEATHGIFAYQSTLRVPLILWQPELLHARVVEAPARHVDLLPTLLDVLGLESPPTDGRSLLPLAAGRGGSNGAASYFESLSPQLQRGWAPLYGVVRGSDKLVELPIVELYDLDADPAENRNLAGERPGLVRELRALLAELRRDDAGPVPSEETVETRKRLESLGYLSAGEPARASYGEADDPKRLIGLDERLRRVAALYTEGDLDGALRESRELVAERPDMRMALLDLAHLEREAGNAEASIEALGRAHALNPADNGTLALFASYLTMAGRPDEALALTEPHSRLEAPDLDVLLVRALALSRPGLYDEALATLDRAARIDPSNPTVPVYRGTVELIAGRPEEAERAYQAALAIDPDVVAAHVSLGMLAIDAGRADEALEHWRRAVEVDPATHERLLRVAMTLWSSGRRDEARPLLELFVAEAPAARYGERIGEARRILEEGGAS
jgi:arylsulfatase A-like enzyme/Flp pilus assembly protein TadD